MNNAERAPALSILFSFRKVGMKITAIQSEQESTVSKYNSFLKVKRMEESKEKLR